MPNTKKTPHSGGRPRPPAAPEPPSAPNARYAIAKQTSRRGDRRSSATPGPSTPSNMFDAMYAIVRQIPKGRVANYGTVAMLAGYPGCSRQVGFALHRNPDPAGIPCHRVVFKDGSLSPAFAFGGENIQRELLENEGVCFIGERVDMGRCGI